MLELHASWAPIALHHPFTNLYILNETVQPFDRVHDYLKQDAVLQVNESHLEAIKMIFSAKKVSPVQ